jgi:hypothetical protein
MQHDPFTRGGLQAPKCGTSVDLSSYLGNGGFTLPNRTDFALAVSSLNDVKPLGLKL